jgi:hypothetical protein
MTQVGQSRLTTATKPSRGRFSGIAFPIVAPDSRMNRRNDFDKLAQPTASGNVGGNYGKVELPSPRGNQN